MEAPSLATRYVSTTGSSARSPSRARPETAASLAIAAAAAAADSGVVPAITRRGEAGRGSKGEPAPGGVSEFASVAVRFAVRIAERLDAAERKAEGRPTVESCYACLDMLRELCPLLGPLEPVLGRLLRSLELCLLSQELCDKPPSECAHERPAGALRGIGKLPFFVLAQRLDEAALALRDEHDAARVKCEEQQADLVQLEEAMRAAKLQLQQKTAVIDKLIADHTQISEELREVKATKERDERQYEVLQRECIDLSREMMQSVVYHKEQVATLLDENAKLRALATVEGKMSHQLTSRFLTSKQVPVVN